ncbi:MAG: methyltransferase domain-containing protein [Alphaproteobacteria bacterium]|nr:methyltransferase domain-containing protein [Alphaproteobacteria bacterium]
MVAQCRVCGDRDVLPLVDFGKLPISHRLRRGADDPDPRYPVNFHLCARCGLLQIVEPIDPALLYSDADAYSTSFQRPAHVPELLTSMVARRDPGPALEIGCNDGFFLKAMRDRGFERLLGIEPNRPVAEAGRRDGLDIVADFFGPDTLDAFKTRFDGGFDFIVARHVLEHVEQIETFLTTVREGLNPGGLFVLELPQVEAGFEGGNPSILWEEHVNYFTVPMVERLLEVSGLEVLDRRTYAFGGGTIAMIAQRNEFLPPRPFALADWTSANLGRPYYLRFAALLAEYQRALAAVVAAYRTAGWRIAVYGAAPRSCTVVNSCGLGDAVDLIIDDRAEIQGRFFPGSDRPIIGFDAVDTGAGPILFLLGVGSENEFKVSRKIANRLGASPRTVSLFPPRRCGETFAAALERLAR